MPTDTPTLEAVARAACRVLDVEYVRLSMLCGEPELFHRDKPGGFLRAAGIPIIARACLRRMRERSGWRLLLAQPCVLWGKIEAHTAVLTHPNYPHGRGTYPGPADEALWPAVILACDQAREREEKG